MQQRVDRPGESKEAMDGKKKGGQRVSTMRIYVFVWIDVAVLTSCPSSPATIQYGTDSYRQLQWSSSQKGV